jgi:hypothetical protein
MLEQRSVLHETCNILTEEERKKTLKGSVPLQRQITQHEEK